MEDPVTVRRWPIFLICLGLIGLGSVPASAQMREQYREPVPPPPPQGDFRGRGGEDFRDRGPPPPPGQFRDGRGERRDELRERMMELRQACEDGDRRSCIRFGIIIGENRERRAQWRRENPNFFWWER